MVRATIVTFFAATLTLAGGYALGQGGNQSVPTYNIQNAWPSKLPPQTSSSGGYFPGNTNYPTVKLERASPGFGASPAQTGVIQDKSDKGSKWGKADYVRGHFALSVDDAKDSMVKKADGGGVKADEVKENKQTGGLAGKKSTQGLIAIPNLLENWKWGREVPQKK